MKPVNPRQGFVALAVLAIAGILIAAHAQVADNNYRCVQYQNNVLKAVLSYAQDYDEKLPPKLDTAAELQFYVKPFISYPAYFICPDTRMPYLANPAVAGQTLAGLDREQTPIVEDPIKHHDNLLTIAYLDGRIVHGGKFIANIRDLCMNNTLQITQSMQLYVQDYDERFPPTNDVKLFDSVLYPYLKSQWKLSCPETGLPYKPNHRLSGLSLVEITNPTTTISVYDAAPHLDGASTVAYLDGHAVHGSLQAKLEPQTPTTPETQCLSNVQQIGLALQMYAQDYDETFPPMQNTAVLERVLTPYIRINVKELFTCPSTKLLYVPNPDLSYVALSSLANPSTTVTIHDAKPHAVDGRSTFGYADGHAARH